MELLIRRDQKAKGPHDQQVVFLFYARVQLTEEEAAHVEKYRMGDTVLYTSLDEEFSNEIEIRGQSSLLISIATLVRGIEFECRSVTILLGVEDRIMEACETFRAVLNVAATFGGEEVYEIE